MSFYDSENMHSKTIGGALTEKRNQNGEKVTRLA